jgi:hypothetical protein
MHAEIDYAKSAADACLPDTPTLRLTPSIFEPRQRGFPWVPIFLLPVRRDFLASGLLRLYPRPGFLIDS